jgi:hypothetical protein
MKEFTIKKDVYAYIADSSTYGNLGLFIGAGVPKALINEDRNIALSWFELLKKCAKKLDIDFDNIDQYGNSYPQIASSLVEEISKSQNETIDHATAILKETISDLTCWYPLDATKIEYRDLFLKLNPNWIITTNYDLVIESLLTDKAYSLQPDDAFVSHKDLIPIYHLHGIRTNPRSLIVTQEDYITLFRPNEYRLQRIPILLKESVTVLIGYSLGDINVLTAVDWVRHVFPEGQGDYPHHIIQLLFKSESPRRQPYSVNGITVIEFNDLKKELGKITKVIIERQRKEEEAKLDRQEIMEFFQKRDDESIELFTSNTKFRSDVYEIYKEYSVYLTSPLLEFLSHCLDRLWEKSNNPGAFFAYDNMLNILIDFLIKIEPNTVQPALIESIAYNLDRVAYYVGRSKGQSFNAHKTWSKRQSDISEDTIQELKRIASINNLYKLRSLLTDGEY